MVSELGDLIPYRELIVDLVGKSRLPAADEEGTLARLKAIRRELADPKIKEHRGRIVKDHRRRRTDRVRLRRRRRAMRHCIAKADGGTQCRDPRRSLDRAAHRHPYRPCAGRGRRRMESSEFSGHTARRKGDEMKIVSFASARGWTDCRWVAGRVEPEQRRVVPPDLDGRGDGCRHPRRAGSAGDYLPSAGPDVHRSDRGIR